MNNSITSCTSTLPLNESGDRFGKTLDSKPPEPPAIVVLPECRTDSSICGCAGTSDCVRLTTNGDIPKTSGRIYYYPLIMKDCIGSRCFKGYGCLRSRYNDFYCILREERHQPWGGCFLKHCEAIMSRKMGQMGQAP